MKVAFYGGSFDPPHVGHILAAAYLTTIAGFERVLVVPVFEHAFDKRLSAFEQRVRMCELAFASLASVEVSRIESELSLPSYTISTVKALLERHPHWQLRVVVGTDVVPEFERWHAIDELRQLAPPFVLGRRGAAHGGDLLDLLPEISSTQIRALCAEYSACRDVPLLAQVVPSAVLEVIREWQLYRVPSS